MAGSPRIDGDAVSALTDKRSAQTHGVGDFTWTGWDYLGEAGIGRTQYAEAPEFAAPYPWLAAWCGDIDITGHRRPASYYREIVFGLRHTPYIAVQRPQVFGQPKVAGQWSWSDSVSSWSWDVAPGSPIIVEVYSDAEEVELLLNGRTVGRKPAGRENAFRTEFELTYEPGELTAVAYDKGVPGKWMALSSASSSLKLAVQADRDQLRDNDSDLSFISIEVQDTSGNLANDVDLPVTLSVAGAGILQGLGSARPDPTERYDSATGTTFDGRILAVIRPTGPGPIEVNVTTPGLETTTVVLTVLDDHAAADGV